MKNGKMNFAELKLLEKDLRRELTDSEAMLGYTKGWRALLEYIGLTDEKYVAYRRLIELLITYCTKDKIAFTRLRNSKDYTDAFALLGDFIADCNMSDCDKLKGFDMDSESADEEDIESEVENVTTEIINGVPDNEIVWLEEYMRVDENLETLKKFATDIVTDEETFYLNDIIGDALDIMKDEVIVRTANRLAETKESEKLPASILSEVCEYIEKNWTNYSMRIVNDVISVKKF